jgi:hypothetical protein
MAKRFIPKFSDKYVIFKNDANGRCWSHFFMRGLARLIQRGAQGGPLPDSLWGLPSTAQVTRPNN